VKLGMISTSTRGVQCDLTILRNTWAHSTSVFLVSKTKNGHSSSGSDFVEIKLRYLHKMETRGAEKSRPKEDKHEPTSVPEIRLPTRALRKEKKGVSRSSVGETMKEVVECWSKFRRVLLNLKICVFCFLKRLFYTKKQ
jgi:hypothetical protein